MKTKLSGLGIDTFEDPVISTFESSIVNVNFFSFVLPLGEDWSIAFYRHKIADLL